jgi:predicted metalloprotease with PDZ domain
MYHAHKKSGTSIGEKITQTDCFVEKTKSWFWIIIILVFVSVVYMIVTSSAQEPVYSTTRQPFPQGGQFQTIALTQCPYCPGFLDARGRCNVRDCPIYSLNWGKTSTSVSVPVRRVLVKELALEVNASQGKGSVIIQSVYPGGNAEKAGLQVGDKIVRFNGRKVKNVKQFESIVARAKPESQVKIKIIQNNEEIKAAVMISEGEMGGVIVPAPPR